MNTNTAQTKQIEETAIVLQEQSNHIAKRRELSLQQKVDLETKNRAILTSFIKTHMKDGVDFGKIHMKKDCPNKYNCTNDYHFSKPSLFKPGAEKVGSLLKVRPDVVRDNDTWEMSGSKKGLFCYRCNLYSLATNELIGMGLGACNTEEKYGNENNAIKCAKKRSFVDAILSTGSLSDFFTQDLEDMVDVTPKLQEDTSPKPTYQAPHVEKTINTQPIEPATPKEIQSSQIIEILRLCGRLHIKIEKLDASPAIRKFNVESHRKLTYHQAEEVIKGLHGALEKRKASLEKIEKEEVKELQQPEPTEEDLTVDPDEAELKIEAMKQGVLVN